MRRNRNLHDPLPWIYALLVFAVVAASGEAQDSRVQQATALLDRAAEQTDAGDYDAAVRDARNADTLFAAAGDLRGRTASLNQAGLAQTYAGQYPEARLSLEAALAMASRARDPEGIVEERMNLASVDFFTGRYADAAAHYDAVRKILATQQTAAWATRRRLLLLINQATLDQRLGRYDEALTSYRIALADPSALRPEEHAQMLSNLGVVYRRLGDPYKALDAYDRARAIFTEHQHVDAELGVLKNRGIVLALDLARLDEALATFALARARAEATGNAREALQALLYGAETQLRQGKTEEAAREFAAAHAAARELETVEDQWKALYGLGRCELLRGNDVAAATRLGEAVAVIEGIRDAIRVPSLRSDFFQDKREVFDVLIALRLRQGASAEELFALVERGHSRGWRDRLGLPSSIDLRSVQRALPMGALLLDYWISAHGAAVISATRSQTRVHPIRVDTSAIQSLTSVLPGGPGSNWARAATTLATQLLPPIPEDHGDLLIVSDGALAAVPFELLPANGRKLVERHSVTYLPTAALLLRPPAPIQAYAAPWRARLRAFGDPVFQAATLEQRTNVPRLLWSAREVRAIAEELGGTSSLFLGEKNSRRSFEMPSQEPLLHLATHAFVDPGAVEQSRILFSAERAGGPATYLFLREAYELRLSHVELTVLSACDTERGRVVAGEGIESFSRAFLAAGARSTVTTLWRVPDATTAAFMRIFYHHLQRGASRAEALRRTKRRFIEQGGALADPHYWAAFVLTGDGLQPVSTALRWRSLFLGVGSLVAAIALAVWWLRRSP